jgi:ABC-type antimicrobial peptide transport system permease subunit
MRLPVSRRYRHVVFAVVMSFVTTLIISGVITGSNAGLDHQFFDHWIKGFLLAWPIVFIVILVVAPLVSRFVDAIVEET